MQVLAVGQALLRRASSAKALRRPSAGLEKAVLTDWLQSELAVSSNSTTRVVVGMKRGHKGL